MRVISKVTNASSLTPLYKSIEIGKSAEGMEAVRACSEFGNIEIWPSEPTGLEQPCILDAAALSAVLQSLPGEADVQLSKKEDKVWWKYASAKGHLSLVQQEHQIPLINPPNGNFPFTPPADFSDALHFADLAVEAATVSIGMFGMVLRYVPAVADPKLHHLLLISSNTISLAMARVPVENYPVTQDITLRPPIPTILATILKEFKGCKMDITKDSIFLWCKDKMAAQLPLSPPLEQDLFMIADKFKSATHKAQIDRSAIKLFLSRASQLIDKHTDSVVQMKIDGGKLILEHTGIAASAEEDFLATGLDPAVKFASISLPINMLMIPLETVDTLILDHIPQIAIVLQKEPTYKYILSGTVK